MTLTLAAAPDLTTTPPSVRLTVTDTTGATTAVTIRRLMPDGTDGVVRTVDGLPLPLTAAPATIYDYEAPFGQPLTYVANDAVISDPVTVNVQQPWLIHLGVPARSVPLTVAGADPRRRPVRQGVFPIMMRKNPIVVTDGQRSSAQASITVRTTTLAELGALDLILDDASTLLLNVPAGKRWGITTEYIAVGDVEEARLLQYGPVEFRHWPLPYQVVDAPVGGTGSTAPGGGGGTPGTRTWADLALEASTWAQAAALYPTWADAAAG